ncbi:uncharacterized protein LOC143584149 [Bidens hawaiensis]|uniref:uncharacterized protein LOC143584149 n=1 Tax=Bidens hawaiensis TaxID=980011 RepID=UPI00404ADDED
MIKLHGPDLNEHPDDYDVWARAARGSRGRILGIGSADPHFLVTGTPSTTSISASYIGALTSQEEVQKVRAEMEKELENKRKSRNELEERVQQREQRMEQMEKELKEKEERRQKQFDEFMRKFKVGSN